MNWFVKDFFDRLRANPLFKQYLHYIERPGRNCEPWHALGQRLFAAGLCAKAIEDKEIYVRGLEKAGDDERTALLRETAEWIIGATPFLWSNSIERVADAAPMPKHTVGERVLPSPAMFWSHETSNSSKGDSFVTNWSAIRHDPEAKGIMIAFDDCETDSNFSVTRPGLAFIVIPYGLTWPNDLEEYPGGVAGIGRFLKRCAFLSSPFVGKDKARLARHHRRQMERAGEPREKVEETVSVVKLRREVKEAVKKSGEVSSVEWQHQWWVSGHYRAQWYPQEEAHRVIWIAPYMKGPSDKPLLEKVYAVVR